MNTAKFIIKREKHPRFFAGFGDHGWAVWTTNYEAAMRYDAAELERELLAITRLTTETITTLYVTFEPAV